MRSNQPIESYYVCQLSIEFGSWTMDLIKLLSNHELGFFFFYKTDSGIVGILVSLVQIGTAAALIWYTRVRSSIFYIFLCILPQLD